jgi:hypothetical protein
VGEGHSVLKAKPPLLSDRTGSIELQSRTADGKLAPRTRPRSDINSGVDDIEPGFSHPTAASDARMTRQFSYVSLLSTAPRT